MTKIIKYLYGYSKSEVILMEDDFHPFIRKTGTPTRNIERMQALFKLGIRVPEIYDIKNDHFDMEFIHGIDMKTFLIRYPPDALTEYLGYILRVMRRSVETKVGKNYNPVFRAKLAFIYDDWHYYQNLFNFDLQELLVKLINSVHPETEYVGDLTMDNILYDGKEFVLIDPATIEYNSWIFDLAKLEQDLTYGWFLRNEKSNHIWPKLMDIRNSLHLEFGFPKYESIMMLFRILPYARIKSKKDEHWLIDRINEAWNTP